jgi:hypothetical protein
MPPNYTALQPRGLYSSLSYALPSKINTIFHTRIKNVTKTIRLYEYILIVTLINKRLENNLYRTER